MDNRKQSSILKQKVRVPLQEVILPDIPDDETVTTTVTRSRRVSFGTNFIKEFIVGSAVSTQCVSEYEHVLSSSDSSRSATASHLFEHSTFSAQENFRLSTEGCALNLSMNKSHSENVSSKGNTDPNRYEFDVDKKQLTTRSDIIKQSKNLGDLHLGPEKVVNKHEDLKGIEKRSKCGKFSSTICFSADSPTADMEFTEGCITLAKSILDKKKKAITVFIQAKPKEEEPDEGDETYVFETSDAEMSITKCIKQDGDSSLDKINKSTMDVDDFTDSDTEEEEEGAPFLSSGKGVDFDGLEEEPNRGILKSDLEIDFDTAKSIFSPKQKLCDVFNFPGDDSMVENMSLDESQIELNLKGEATYMPQSEGMDLTKCVIPPQKLNEEKYEEVFQTSAMDFTKCVREEKMEDSMNVSGCEPVLMEETPCKRIPLNKPHVSFVHDDLESSGDDSMDVTGCLNVPSNPDVSRLFSFPPEKEKIDSLDDLTESEKRDSVDSFVGGLFTGGNNNNDVETSLSDKKDFEDSGMDLTEGLLDEVGKEQSLSEHLEEKLADGCGNDDLDEFEDGEEEKENQDPLLRVIAVEEGGRLDFQDEEGIDPLSPENIQEDSLAKEIEMVVTPAKVILNDDSHISVSAPEVFKADETPIQKTDEEEMELTPVKLILNDSHVSVSKPEGNASGNTFEKCLQEKNPRGSPEKIVSEEERPEGNMPASPVKSVGTPEILTDDITPEKSIQIDGSSVGVDEPLNLSLEEDSTGKLPVETCKPLNVNFTELKLQKSSTEKLEDLNTSKRNDDRQIEPETEEVVQNRSAMNLTFNPNPEPEEPVMNKKAMNLTQDSKPETEEPGKNKTALNHTFDQKPEAEEVARNNSSFNVTLNSETDEAAQNKSTLNLTSNPETENAVRNQSALNLTYNQKPEKEEELLINGSALNQTSDPISETDARNKSTLNLTFSQKPEAEAVIINGSALNRTSDPNPEALTNKSAFNLTFNQKPETEEILMKRSALNRTSDPNPEEAVRNKNAFNLTLNQKPETEEIIMNGSALNQSSDPETDARNKSGLNLTFNPKPAPQESDDSAIEPDKESGIDLDVSMNEVKPQEAEPKDNSRSVINSNTIILQNETPHNDRTAATFTLTPKNATYVVPNQTYVLEEEEKTKEPEIVQTPEKENIKSPEKENVKTPEKVEYPVKEAVKRLSVELSPLPENQHKKHRLSSDCFETGIRLVTDVSFNDMDSVSMDEMDEDKEPTNVTTENHNLPPPPLPSPSPIPDDKMEIDPSKSFSDVTIGDGKIIALLIDQAKETNCLWKIKQLNKNEQDSWIFTFDILQSTAALEFKIKPSDEYSLVSESRITLIHDDEYLTDLPLTVIEFGFSKLEEFFQSEKKVENVRHISYFLDLLNSFSSKLDHHLKQILSILEGYPGSSLKNEALSFRLFSFPALFSSDVIVDLKNLTRLSKDSLSFERHFGELNENEIKNIFDESVKSENSLTDFIVSSTKYIIRLELELGRISKRDHIGLLPDYLKKL